MSEALSIKKLSLLASGSTARLKGMGKPLWRLLTFSPAHDAISAKKSVCVAVERAEVSVSYGSRSFSRLKLNGYKRQSFDGTGFPQTEELASSAALAVSDLRATKAEITLSIPKAWAIIRTAEMPSVVRDTLPEVVSYELDRLTPFAAEEAYYDFGILKETDGKLTLLIIAAKADLINPYLNALKEKGLTVSRLIVNLSGMGALLHYGEQKRDLIFIEVRADGYEGALFSEGALTEVMTDSFAGADEKSKVDVVVSEIETLTNAAKQQGRDPRVILLLRDKSPSLKELLKLHASLPITLLDETALKIPGSQRDIPYASLGGMVDSLWPKSRGLNLFSMGRHERSKAPVGFTIILLITVIALLIAYMVTPFQIEGKRLEDIDRQISMKKDEARKVENLKKEIDALNTDISTIAAFKESRPMALNILKELTTVLPKTSWLTRVRITETNVEIEGYAGSATELLPKLEASPFFKKAEFASPTFRDARMNSDRFIIKMEIEGIKKAEGTTVKNGKK
ncbi:MAG TPA: PilN domain-containing protein [Thermodesulfovibrionales bacterium]|nr:PilN domain-containing protein [Thermodesulfovibrionales bacterium]